jgi:hypothetical protein
LSWYSLKSYQEEEERNLTEDELSYFPSEAAMIVSRKVKKEIEYI